MLDYYFVDRLKGIRKPNIVPTTGIGWTWGNNTNWTNGTVTSEPTSTPVLIYGSHKWKNLAAGLENSYGIDDNDDLYGWGKNYTNTGFGSVGGNVKLPQQLPGKWNQISEKWDIIAGLSNTNELYYWGYTPGGTLISTPAIIDAGISNWTRVSTGSKIIAGIRNDGSLWTWGDNSVSQLGNGTSVTANAGIFSTMVGSSGWNYVTCGTSYMFAIKTDGSLWAWGNNGSGQLGVGDQVNRSTPTLVDSSTWVSVAGGTDHAIGIKTDGSLWGWGDNDQGQLGTSSTFRSLTPLLIDNTSRWKSVEASYKYSYGIKQDDTLWAWGYNFYNHLGIGLSSGTRNVANVSYPTQVGSLTNWLLVSAGKYHTLGITSS